MDGETESVNPLVLIQPMESLLACFYSEKLVCLIRFPLVSNEVFGCPLGVHALPGDIDDIHCIPYIHCIRYIQYIQHIYCIQYMRCTCSLIEAKGDDLMPLPRTRRFRRGVSPPPLLERVIGDWFSRPIPCKAHRMVVAILAPTERNNYLNHVRRIMEAICESDLVSLLLI
ncbi:unnamed protein product [Ascophyllum nodosum]